MICPYLIAEIIIFCSFTLLFRNGLKLINYKRLAIGFSIIIPFGVIWDCIAVKTEMWTFNGIYVIKYAGIPIIEETLFCILVPFITILVWEWSKTTLNSSKPDIPNDNDRGDSQQ